MILQKDTKENECENVCEFCKHKGISVKVSDSLHKEYTCKIKEDKH